MSFEIVTIELSEELQAAEARFSVLPSLKVPIAFKAWLVPTAIDGLLGVKAIETSPAGTSVAGWYNSALASILAL